MYAEAQNKADHGPNTFAYEQINKVRKRAMGGIDNPLTPNLDEEEFDKAVFDERGWEFFCEFKRWFQLVRNVYLMPLPSEEVQSCGFTQNPR